MQHDPALEKIGRRELIARYAEIAELAGGLAHEIRNPLSTISLNLELMEEDLHEGESEAPRDRRLRKKVQVLRRECENLTVILDEFLQFARLGELQLVPTNLNDAVSEFLEFFRPQAAEHAVELSPHLGGDLPPVALDRALFRQALGNLALNAVQAMPDGGVLELLTYARGDRVHLELIDNGIGMDAATQAGMYRAFFSSKRGGSGLGLPTVRKIVVAHEGEIHCQSEPGKGTRFTISLPARNDI